MISVIECDVLVYSVRVRVSFIEYEGPFFCMHMHRGSLMAELNRVGVRILCKGFIGK